MTRLLMLSFLAVSLGAFPAQSPFAACESTLCRMVASGSLPDLRWPDFSDYKSRVQAFYESTDYALAWTQGGAPTGQAKVIIETFKSADAKGLNPEDYDASRWADRISALSRTDNRSSEDNLIRFDLTLTVCLMRYISDLHLGKVNPGLFHKSFDLPGQNNLPTFIRRQLVSAPNVKSTLEEIEPPYEGYRRTQKALQKYLAMARQDVAVSLPPATKPVEPGTSYTAAAQLAAVLRLYGDLSADFSIPPESNIYDGSLVDAVRHFQTRHGLETDGRLGKATLEQLNVPLGRRVRQLQLTLERWRWVPHSFPRPPIVVNIPEFKLRALNDSYQTELEMKVVVGKAYGHQTPVFTADMSYVIFRPYWNVPLSIQRAELVPKLARDRSYLAGNGYEVTTTRDVVVSRGTVDDAVLAQLRLGKLRIRQIPGPDNSLGPVKFLFPNEHNVYLHGTPAAQLFSKSRRDFSHGCIRVEKPAQLAEWVLRKTPAWTLERILETMNGAKTIQVTLDRPIPVLIVYATAVVLESGEVRFFEDIYKQDIQLEQLLSKGYPYRREATGAGRGTRPRE